jgi:glycosyltransferase involved in cell wall biosynthesis
MGYFPDVEIFISDNCSTDDTFSMVQKYQKYFHNIRYSLNAHNLGFNGNVICCFEKAIGEYISFISDDDLVPPGTFPRILQEIRLRRPSIIYLNHHPFHENDPRTRLPDKHDSHDRLFNNGKDFFIYCGLGFLSSLTIRSDFAQEFITLAKKSIFSEPHLDISSRIALTKEGPFIFLGSISIWARVPIPLENDYVTCHILKVDHLYQDLYAEGLMDKLSFRKHMRISIRSLLLRNVLYNKCVGDYRVLQSNRTGIFELYREYIIFFLIVYPILILPRFLIKGPYCIIRAMIQRARIIRLNQARHSRIAKN